MKLTTFFSLIAVPFVTQISTVAAEVDVIPRVTSATTHKKQYELGKKMQIVLPSQEVDRVAADARRFAEFLHEHIGTQITVTKQAISEKHVIQLEIQTDDFKGKAQGAYQLKVTDSGIKISSAGASGIFYGLQTLKQLLPLEAFQNSATRESIMIPQVEINDSPRFSYRGFMLDSCRHIQSIEKIKQYLDLMAFYKFNVFHWHLTEDEAWRMEIKKYPKLTSVGAYPGDKSKKEELNGYYTQKQLREIVEYANARHIKVIPEFDIPGHVNALLMAYPEYSCEGKPLEMGELGLRAFSSKAGRRALCAGKHEAVIPMVMDIFEEMKPIFTDGIFHIGGDERPRGLWEKCSHCQEQKTKLGLKDEHYLQNWFLNEVSERLRKDGIRSMAWGEHMKGGVPEGQIVQAWLGNRDVHEGVKAGREVVNSLNGHYYLDYPSTDKELDLYAKWMRGMRVSTHSIYHNDPVPSDLTEQQAKLVIGIEAPVWTETIKMDRLDKKVFPRLLAVAENAWTDKKQKNWKSFQKRYGKHQQLLATWGVEYDRTDQVLEAPVAYTWSPKDTPAQFKGIKMDVTKLLKQAQKHQFEFVYKKGAHGLSIRKVEILADGKKLGEDAHEGFAGGSSTNNTYTIDLVNSDALKGAKKLELHFIVQGEGGTESSGEVHYQAIFNSFAQPIE